MAKKDSINLTVEEQLVIQDRLGQIWKNAPYRKVASLIAEIHLAVFRHIQGALPYRLSAAHPQFSYQPPRRCQQQQKPTYEPTCGYHP